MPYTIEAKRYPVLRTPFGHLYIEIWDAQGNRIEQINGFGTDRKTGKAHPYFGRPEHQLKGYRSVRDRVEILGTGSTQATNTHKGIVLFQGSRGDIDNALTAADEAIRQINSGDHGYKLFAQHGYNSNSVFNTVVLAMQEALPAISDEAILQARRMGRKNPGCTRVIEAYAPKPIGQHTAPLPLSFMARAMQLRDGTRKR